MSTFSNLGLIVAILEPKPGKANDLIEAYNDFIKTLKPREPDCVEFVLYRQTDTATGVDKFFTVERFKTTDAIPFHRENPALDVFNKVVAQKDILVKPVSVATCEPVIGFEESR